MVDVAQMKREFSPQDSSDDTSRLAIEACPDGMVMTDDRGIIILVNAEIERMFGYQRSELIGQPVEILMPHQARGAHPQQRRNFMRRPEIRRMGGGRVLTGRRRDGSELPIEIGLYPIQHDDGPRVLAVIIDLDERSRTDRLKDEFVSTVSHELRTPLTSIAGSLGLLSGGAGGQLPESALRLIRIAHSNSQRLVRLINDILDIEKIESGQTIFKFKRLTMRSLAEQVIEANRAFADGFHVRVRLDDDASTGEVYADPDRLAQVLTNLLSNAVKFSPAEAEVSVSVTERDENVCVAVRDHGPGIPREFKRRVFEKFAQADATDTRQKGGTGLGLSIVKQIVNRLGGTVGFDDADGGGTVFYVTLPAWTKVAAQEIDHDTGPHNGRILFCEDNLDVAFAVRYGLRPSKLTTDFAHSRDEVIARAKTARYDAIVVDLDLPDGDGVGLIRAIRAQPNNYKTPIAVISADGCLDNQDIDASRLGIRACVPKPVEIERLAQALEGFIVRNADGRPQILHVDDDRDVLEIVAQTLEGFVNVVSVESLEEARCALLMHHFDLVILDIHLGTISGLDLLPELRSGKGRPIPVIVFSADGSALKSNLPIEAQLSKGSAGSLKGLVNAVHDRLMLGAAPPLEGES